MQGEVDVVVGPVNLTFLHEAACAQAIKVFGGGQVRDLQVAFDKFDFCIGVGEQVVDQILAVEFVAGADAVFVAHERCLDGSDSCSSGLFHCI